MPPGVAARTRALVTTPDPDPCAFGCGNIDMLAEPPASAALLIESE
jgi:hypothetical protein